MSPPIPIQQPISLMGVDSRRRARAEARRGSGLCCEHAAQRSAARAHQLERARLPRRGQQPGAPAPARGAPPDAPGGRRPVRALAAQPCPRKWLRPALRALGHGRAGWVAPCAGGPRHGVALGARCRVCGRIARRVRRARRSRERRRLCRRVPGRASGVAALAGQPQREPLAAQAARCEASLVARPQHSLQLLGACGRAGEHVTPGVTGGSSSPRQVCVSATPGRAQCSGTKASHVGSM